MSAETLPSSLGPYPRVVHTLYQDWAKEPGEGEGERQVEEIYMHVPIMALEIYIQYIIIKIILINIIMYV